MMFGKVRLNAYVALVLLRDRIEFFRMTRERVRTRWAAR